MMKRTRTHFDPTNGPVLFSDEEICDIIASEQFVPLFCNSPVATEKPTSTARVTKQLNSISIRQPNAKAKAKPSISRFESFDLYDTCLQPVKSDSILKTLLEDEVCFQPTDAEYWAGTLKYEFNVVNHFDLLWTDSEELLEVGMPHPLIDKILCWQKLSDVTNNF